MSQICQSWISILPNKKINHKNEPMTCKLLPKWQNFAKPGHTDSSSFFARSMTGGSQPRT